jgi:hypothetical protein
MRLLFVSISNSTQLNTCQSLVATFVKIDQIQLPNLFIFAIFFQCGKLCYDIKQINLNCLY